MPSSEIAFISFDGADNLGPCTFTSDLIGVSAHSEYLTAIEDAHSGQVVGLEIDLSVLPTAELTIELTYAMASNVVSQSDSPLLQSFTINVSPGCTPELLAEGLLESYTFVVDDPAVLISLEGISNNDCSYDLALNNVKTGITASPTIFTLS